MKSIKRVMEAQKAERKADYNRRAKEVDLELERFQNKNCSRNRHPIC